MINQIKRIIRGTPLESIARKAKNLFTKRHVALYDVQTLEVMRRVLKKDSNCIDIGCHRGSFLKDMLLLAPDGDHFAFEPIPELYKGLLTSFRSVNNVHFYDVALSDTEGETSFQHVVSNPGYSGLRKRKYERSNEEVHEITVKTRLLDNIIKDNDSINFIKVDVEGAELLVFKGAVKTIIKNKPVIVFEHGLGGADYYQNGPNDIYKVLVEECGMKLFLMSEWLEDSGKSPLTKQAFSEQFSTGKNYYFMAHG